MRPVKSLPPNLGCSKIEEYLEESGVRTYSFCIVMFPERMLECQWSRMCFSLFFFFHYQVCTYWIRLHYCMHVGSKIATARSHYPTVVWFFLSYLGIIPQTLMSGSWSLFLCPDALQEVVRLWVSWWWRWMMFIGANLWVRYRQWCKI